MMLINQERVMPLNFSSALGIHEQALTLRTKRAEILANNIANADTPGFKARDLDFKSVLEGYESQGLKLKNSHAGHMGSGGDEYGDPSIKFRVPDQPSIDGNTVDAHREKAEYLKNSLQFQSSFRFLNGSLKGLKSALRGD